MELGLSSASTVYSEFVADVFGNVRAVVQLSQQVAAQVTHFIVLTNHVRILQNLLVRIETVYTHTNIEDDVVKREFCP